jgi:hypothetical protein
MLKVSLLTLSIVGLISVAGCSRSRSTGQIDRVDAPGYPQVTYRVVKNVNSKGSASAKSPIILGMDSAIERANEDAVGKAIFEDNGIDAVIAPKTRVTTTSFIFFGFADVELKGRGVEIIGPK